jgi:hypothetical protein
MRLGGAVGVVFRSGLVVRGVLLVFLCFGCFDLGLADLGLRLLVRLAWVDMIVDKRE